MPQPAPGPDDSELLRRMQELERRVARLEQRFEPAPLAAAGPGSAAGPVRTAWSEGSRAVPALGRALLGMAGAYGLRALSESHTVPRWAGVFSAILYASAWLVWAARTPAARRTEAALYSLTSALVLGPVVWEATLRFRAISSRTAAVILFSFTVFAWLISWRKNYRLVATVATCASLFTTLLLLILSHDVMPFLFLLMAIAVVVEIAGCLDHGLGARWLAAAAADLAVLLATYLAATPGSLPETYAPIPKLPLLAAQIALPGIYLSSTIARTLTRHSTFTIFEAGQLAIAFLLALGGGLRLADSPVVVAALAVFLLGCGVACYTAGFLSQAGVHRTYLVFGFVLLAAGSRMALSGEWAVAAWSGLAIACISMRRPALLWHGSGYLLLALGLSGALAHATEALLGSADGRAGFASLLAGTALALLCRVLLIPQRAAHSLLPRLVTGAAFWLAAGLAAALLTGSYHRLFGAVASHAYCATLRTAVLAAGALLLAWAGSLWNHPELSPLVYPLMVLGAYRLLLVDLRQESKTAMVFSLLFYGVTLILLPRSMKPRQTAAR